MNLYSFRYLNLTMAVGLGKRIAIVELFKAGKPQKEICKDLKVNRCWSGGLLKGLKKVGICKINQDKTVLNLLAL